MHHFLLAAFCLGAIGCIDTSGLVFDQGEGAASGTSYETVVLSDGPLAYWPLDTIDNGTRTPDVTGNGHDATLDAGTNGEVLFDVPAVVGTGAAISNGAELLVMAGHPLAFGDSSYSLEGWLRVAGDFSNFASCREQKMDGSGYITNVDETSLTHKRLTASGGIEDAAADGVDFGGLRHVVVVYDAVANEGQLYVDGTVRVLPAKMWSSGWLVTTEPFYLAESGNSATVTVDEVAVYDKALSSDQVTAHFECGSSQSCD